MERSKRVPFYKQVKDDISRKIHAKVYLPGFKLPSERELAALYNINRLTVRHAIEELVHESILTRRQGSGTYVATGEILQKTTRAKPIGVFVAAQPAETSYTLNAYFGMETTAAREGLAIKLVSIPAQPESEIVNAIAKQARFFRGLVLGGFDGPTTQAVLREVGLPSIVLGHVVDPTEQGNYDIVGNDAFFAAYQLTTRLVDMGHRRIGIALPPPDRGGIAYRQQHNGYQGALRAHGVSVTPAFEFFTSNAYRLFRQEVSDGILRELTALIFTDIPLLVSGLMALKERGLNIPGEKSVAGMGIDIELARMLDITMATPDFESLGQRAIESLLARLKGPGGHPRLILVEDRILVRSSFSACKGVAVPE